MVEKFYTKTGMFIDWQQLESLPEIDTLIDIGVGPDGTEDLYRVFKKPVIEVHISNIYKSFVYTSNC